MKPYKITVEGVSVFDQKVEWFVSCTRGSHSPITLDRTYTSRRSALKAAEALALDLAHKTVIEVVE